MQRILAGAVDEALFRDGLCLPSGCNLTQADLFRVGKVVRGCRGMGQA